MHKQINKRICKCRYKSKHTRICKHTRARNAALNEPAQAEMPKHLYHLCVHPSLPLPPLPTPAPITATFSATIFL